MIEVKNLTKSFQNGDVVTHVLKGIDLKVESGEFISIMGRSGAGKSTLLYQLSLLDEPTTGEVLIEGKAMQSSTQKEKTNFRLNEFGYVFQDYALLPELTALENVSLPLLMQNTGTKHANEHASDALARVGLAHRLQNLPSRMSGGEQQRVSIARAIAHKPKILFADEPTANLDNESSRIVMDIFTELHKLGQTIIMVTHEEEFARLAQKTLILDDGKIIDVRKNH